MNVRPGRHQSIGADPHPPVLAGRADSPRLGLVEGVELLPGTRVAGSLRSVRTNGSHLFLRYALS